MLRCLRTSVTAQHQIDHGITCPNMLIKQIRFNIRALGIQIDSLSLNKDDRFFFNIIILMILIIILTLVKSKLY